MEQKPIELEPKSKSQSYQKIQQNITETTQNISSPQYTFNNPLINQNKNKFEIETFLKQNKDNKTTTTQIENKNISSNNNISQINNIGSGGFIQQKTETTKTTTIPTFSQNQTQQQILSQSIIGKINNDEFIKSFLDEENMDKYYAENATTNTTSNGQYQINQEIEKETNEKIRLSEYDSVSEIIKQRTIITEANILDPIINKIQTNNSYNKALLGEPVMR